MKITTDNPYRDIWTAYDIDNYEPGAQMGQGKTEQEAINNLVDDLVNLAYEEGWRDACRKHGVEE